MSIFSEENKKKLNGSFFNDVKKFISAHYSYEKRLDKEGNKNYIVRVCIKFGNYESYKDESLYDVLNPKVEIENSIHILTYDLLKEMEEKLCK